MKKILSILLGALLIAVFLFYFNKAANIGNQGDATAMNTKEYVLVDEFGANGQDSKDDSHAIQEAIHYSYNSKIGKVKLPGNRRYILKKGLILEEGVELEFGLNTRLIIDGNFTAIQLKKNASISNGIFEIVNKDFEADVIYLDGSQKFWSWERTQVNNVTILNTTGSHKGTGLHLYADGADHYISFVNFTDLRIAGFNKGVFLEVKKPGGKNSFINGNRFINLTLDDCIRCIELDSSISVPNESSGNDFRGLQIQLAKNTKKAIVVSGSDNRFEGVIWDVELLKDNRSIIEFTRKSMRNYVFSNIRSDFITDKGRNNYHSSPEEEAMKTK